MARILLRAMVKLPQTANRKLQTTNHNPQTINCKPQTTNHVPYTTNSKPSTANRKPQPTLHAAADSDGCRRRRFLQHQHLQGEATSLNLKKQQEDIQMQLNRRFPFHVARRTHVTRHTSLVTPHT